MQKKKLKFVATYSVLHIINISVLFFRILFNSALTLAELRTFSLPVAWSHWGTSYHSFRFASESFLRVLLRRKLLARHTKGMSGSLRVKLGFLALFPPNSISVLVFSDIWILNEGQQIENVVLNTLKFEVRHVTDLKFRWGIPNSKSSRARGVAQKGSGSGSHGRSQPSETPLRRDLSLSLPPWAPEAWAVHIYM